ncbi:PIG-L deacetylase family protein [Ktedonosporobacter rubrisoli]|uniref:PIG-L deacetylase family protein n=1 Tax=Ktedonosporobacter rubrisoli TaxID=2509675 RepID=UPI0013EE5BBD|nr:PIG-L family deacetylase [Ktedonosporobacter rubrisoli]
MSLAIFEDYSYTKAVITNDAYDFIYISPHLDDVAFSCSGTICSHRAQGLHILVVTLFTGDPKPPFSPLAQTYHRLWQVPEDTSAYQARKAEDEKAMLALETDYLWLDWREVIYRITDLANLSEVNDYTVLCQHDPLFPQLCQWFIDLQAAYPNSTIVGPLGTGGHRDHRLIFQAALSVIDPDSLLFFEDFPYAAYLPGETFELAKAYKLEKLEIDISPYLEQRIHVTSLYQSQLATLFYPPSAFRNLIREYTAGGGQQSFIERYWKPVR